MIIEFALPDKPPIVHLEMLLYMLNAINRRDSVSDEAIRYIDDITLLGVIPTEDKIFTHTKGEFITTFTYYAKGKISLVSKRIK